MQDNLEFHIKYKHKSYSFKYGSEVYIFHTGIYYDLDKKFSMKTLLKYVALTHHCYLSDSNRTPLGALSDFIAENWKKVKDLSRYDILEKFYDTHY